MTGVPDSKFQRPFLLLAASVSTKTLQFFISFVIMVMIARTWGAAGLGLYGTGAAYGSLSLLAIDLGVNVAAQRWFVQFGLNESLYARLIKNKLILTAACLPLILIILRLVTGYGGSRLLTAGCIAGVGATAALQGVPVAVLRVSGRMSYELRVQLIERVSSIALVLGLGIFHVALLGLGLGMLFIALAVCLVLDRRARIQLAPGPMPVLRVLDALPFAGALAFETVAFRFDAVLLPHYVRLDLLGDYVAAYRFVFAAAGLAAAVQAVLLNRWVPLNGVRRGNRDVFLRLTTLISAVTFSISFLFPSVLLAPFGASISGSSFILRGLAASIAIVPLHYMVSLALVADGRTRWFLAGWGTAGSFNLIANLVLIPKYGVTAAITTTVITDFLLLAIWSLGAHRSRAFKLPSLLGAMALGCLVLGVSLAFMSGLLR